MKRVFAVIMAVVMVLSFTLVYAGAEEVEIVESEGESVSFYSSDSAVALLADSGISTYSTISSGQSDNTYLWMIAMNTDDIWNDMRSGFDKVLTQLRTVNAYLSTLEVSSGVYFLDYSGSLIMTEAQVDLTYLIRSGFMGLANRLKSYLYFDGSYLLYDGSLSTSGGSVAAILRNGIIYISNGLNNLNSTVITMDNNIQNGLNNVQSSVDVMDSNTQDNLEAVNTSLHSLIAGSATNNTYSGTITSNENTETSIKSTGLGPMLNTWLDAIQSNTGSLAYMFASPADLEAKKKSESTTQAVTDTFLSSESDASVSTDSVSAIGSASSSIQGLGNTGVSAGQAFSTLDDESLFSFFSAETASNLDTVPMTLSRDPDQEIVTNYYEQSRLDFFNLIGKENDE